MRSSDATPKAYESASCMASVDTQQGFARGPATKFDERVCVPVDEVQTLRHAKARARQDAHDIDQIFSVTHDEDVTRVGESARDAALQTSV